MLIAGTMEETWRSVSSEWLGEIDRAERRRRARNNTWIIRCVTISAAAAVLTLVVTIYLALRLG